MNMNTLIDNGIRSIVCIHELTFDDPWLRIIAQVFILFDREFQFQLLPCFFSTFAHVSFSATVRLNTGFPGLESGSAQKYPRRSN